MAVSAPAARVPATVQAAAAGLITSGLTGASQAAAVAAAAGTVAAPAPNGEIIIAYTQQTVPEPGTLALVGGGAAALVSNRWRRLWRPRFRISMRADHWVFALAAVLAAALSSTTARGQNIFVSNLSGTVGEYTLSGSTVNASLIVAPPETLAGIAVSGSNVFVSETNGTIGEYTTSGGSLIGTIVTGGSGEGLVVSGSDLFVDNYNEGGPGTIGEYTTSGGTVNASLITGLNNPTGLAVFGTDRILFGTIIAACAMEGKRRLRQGGRGCRESWAG